MPKVLSVAITHEAMDETIFLLISEKNTFLLIDKNDRHPHQHCPEVCNYLIVNRGNAINAAFLIDSITRFERMLNFNATCSDIRRRNYRINKLLIKRRIKAPLLPRPDLVIG